MAETVNTMGSRSQIGGNLASVFCDVIKSTPSGIEFEVVVIGVPGYGRRIPWVPGVKMAETWSLCSVM